MISITKIDDVIRFTFSNSQRYPYGDGTIDVPVNSLSLVTDSSDMATFRKAATNDIFISGLYSEFGKTKAELETYFKENMVSTGGGGGGTSYEDEFKGMIDKSITEANIPSGVTVIGDYAFYYCTALSSVTIPNSIASIGANAFTYCSGLTSIDIPSGVVSIGTYAFSGCSSLTSCTIGSGVTTIGQYTFQNCTALSSVTIPNSVTSIGLNAFYYCTALSSVTIPNSVINIGNGAFRYCSGLTSAAIGSGVISIGSRGFQGCSSLTSITVNATTPPTLSTAVFDNTNNCPIYVPTDSVDSYKAAWSEYADRITAITS